MFLPYMPDVARCELSLRELNQMWQLIESSAKMNCPAEARLLLPAMVATRTGFAHLEQALIANLVQEKVRHVLANLGTQARYAIDILVRNLFERTADVGFLATDADLCAFVANHDDDNGDGDAVLEAARQRLAAYRDKYTVYDEIMLLDTAGRVLVQADTTTPVTWSRDALLAATLATDGYVETFRATDLRPGKSRALVYSHRMRDPRTGEPVGVLCLCFNFEQEMDAIFAAYRDPSHRANMLLLDAQDRVISSADPLWIPAGVQVPVNTQGAGGAARPLLFGGREYLVQTFGCNDYQGYPGPTGWKAQLMVPLDLAFRDSGADVIQGADAQLVQGLLSHAQAFSPPLHELMTAVTRTTRTIGRIVWNGKVTSHTEGNGSGSGGNNSRLNTILDQISGTGARSDALFSRSIRDLYQTVLAASISQAELTSQLLVDMLDRNLYERANDCRWWALTAQLRRGLAEGGNDDAIKTVLVHINRLYTVYARLFVYDRQGRIVAATGAGPLPCTHVDADTLGRVCALRSELDHHVERFAPSALYDGAPTFIYHAAIRHPEQAANVVGGIGVVFDAGPELANMLHSGVAGRRNMHAYFITPERQVLASTDAAHPPGATLALPATQLAALLAAGDRNGRSSGALMMEHDGQYVIAACSRAAGYREFRTGAGVEQPVLALLLESFGPVRDARELAALGAQAVQVEQMEGAEAAGTGTGTGTDYAIFHAGGALMALQARTVQEAVPFARVQRAPGNHPARVGMLDVAPGGGSKQFVWVFDLALLATGRAAVITDNSQVMLVKFGAGAIGLLVDDLHSVQQFSDDALTASPMGAGAQALAPRLIKANGGHLLIEEIDLERLALRLRT